MRRLIQYIAALSVLATPVLAEAHLRLTDPLPRYGDSQKAGPCGVANGVRAGNVYTFAPGETITIKWNEFINHPGHFRISFDADGDDDFVNPAGYDDLNSAPSVLADGIADKAGGDYTYDITLPDVECDNCTLQVIQVMTDKPPYGDGNDIYYQCVDLVLTKGGQGGGADGGPAGPDAGASVDPPNSDKPLGGGCSSGGDTGPAFAALMIGLWFAMRRQRVPGRCAR